MIEFGLFEVAGNPNLTFIFFVGLTILVALGLRFAYYAFRNRNQTDVEAEASIWMSLFYIGLLGAGYGLIELFEIVSSLRLPAGRAVLLAMTLALAFAMARIYRVSTRADGSLDGPSPAERALRIGLIGLVALLAVVLAVDGESALAAGLEGASAAAVAGYGLVFYRNHVEQSRLQGTMLDSLVRHLLPVLVFAALTSVVGIAIILGLSRIVVLHVQVVFIIMTATALMTGTIKLQQNVANR